MASTLAVDPLTGHVVVCGSTTGGLFEDPKLLPESGSLSTEAKELGNSHDPEPFCAKLATSDGQVSFRVYFLSSNFYIKDTRKYLY